MSLRRAAAALTLLVLAVSGPPAVWAQPADALAIPINLRCTTCDDFIRCTPSTARAGDPVVVYRLREKTFWAQIATIGDYALQWFRPKLTDERPLARYVGEPASRRIEQDESWRARVDSRTATITLPDARIDQRSGRWSGLDGGERGHCIAMKRREGFALVRAFLGRPLPVRT